MSILLHAISVLQIDLSAPRSYRFRLVSISCDPNYTFSIDGHNLTVIEVDGINSQPLLVDSIQIFAAQRYSFVVCPALLVLPKCPRSPFLLVECEPNGRQLLGPCEPELRNGWVRRGDQLRHPALPRRTGRRAYYDPDAVGDPAH